MLLVVFTGIVLSIASGIPAASIAARESGAHDPQFVVIDEAAGQWIALLGSPAEAVDTLGRYAEAGATRAYLQVLDLADLDHLDLVAAEVAPQLA